MLELFAERRQAGEPLGVIQSHHLMHFMVARLISDGYLEIVKQPESFVFGVVSAIEYGLTDAGVELIDLWIGAQPLAPSLDED